MANEVDSRQKDVDSLHDDARDLSARGAGGLVSRLLAQVDARWTQVRTKVSTTMTSQPIEVMSLPDYVVKLKRTQVKSLIINI